MPRNDSAVSPKIAVGMETVSEAIRWLVKLGSRCRPMMRAGEAPMSCAAVVKRSEEHTSELQSLMRISYAVFCLKKKKKRNIKKSQLLVKVQQPKERIT